MVFKIGLVFKLCTRIVLVAIIYNNCIFVKNSDVNYIVYKRIQLFYIFHSELCYTYALNLISYYHSDYYYSILFTLLVTT